MSKKSRAVRRYQIRCAEQQELIEVLEKENKRLHSSIWELKIRNRGLEIDVRTLKAKASEEKKCTKSNEEKEEYDSENFPSPKEQEENKKKEFTTYKEQAMYECQQFLTNHSFNDFYHMVSEEIIGQENDLKKILAVIYNYLQTIAYGEKLDKPVTAILTAPSGNGKTAIVKCLTHILQEEIPSLVCSRRDASRLLPEGYRGVTVSSILTEFALGNKNDTEQRYGFLWLDEFDKIRFNCDSGPQVQNQILTFLDGQIVKYGDVKIDTAYICWIAMGSFNEVRKKKQQKTEKTIGFANQAKEYDAFDEITREDMLSIFSYETIGRFQLIVSFKRLSRDAIQHIILKTTEEVGKKFHTNIVLSEIYAEELIAAANSEYGCRQLYSIIYETSLEAYITMMQDNQYDADACPTIVLEGKGMYSLLNPDVVEQIDYCDM